MAIEKIDELKFISKLIVTTAGVFLPFLAYFVDRLILSHQSFPSFFLILSEALLQHTKQLPHCGELV